MKVFDDFLWHLIFDNICLMTQDSLDIWWHLFEMTSCSGHLFVICLKSYFLYDIWWPLIVYMWWHLHLMTFVWCIKTLQIIDNIWLKYHYALDICLLFVWCLISLKIFDSICLFTFDDIWYLITFVVETRSVIVHPYSRRVFGKFHKLKLTRNTQV